ncbi:MAG: hypothetical protein P8Q94_05525, partial [Candidatus Poseidoniaceae archaeon]|nr:hypothetical protein [Candidatus Poseidoniaceae archaeon]
MKKILAVLFACSIVLAGCMDLTDEDIDSIVDAIVEIPGCNADETAYNYDKNATNNNACLTEMVLKNSIADFITLMDNGPSADQTMGMTMEGTDDSWQDQQLNWVSVNAYSPNGVYTSMEIDNSGFTMWSQSQLITAAEDGTTLIQVDWNGERMLMNSATQYSTWNSMDMDDDDDDMDMNNNMVMGDMETPEVEIPDTFDPSTALFEAGLATDNGYAFSTIMDDGMGYSMTMTFTLGMDLVVNSMTLTETMGDESSTSSITMLGDYALRGYLTISTDTTIPYQALPFGTTPMNGMDNADDDCDDECNDDEIDWESYNGGYCAWEGNSDDGENVWSCKYDEADNSWDTWWYYCELHDGDWHCTDDLGQSSENENSADLERYDADEGNDNGDDGQGNSDISAALTDNWASSLNDYSVPEFSIYTGFDNVNRVHFDLYDMDGNAITSMTIQPTEFTDMGDGYMIYYVDINHLLTDVGCYTLVAAVVTNDDVEIQWVRDDICNYGDDDGDDDSNVDEWEFHCIKFVDTEFVTNDENGAPSFDDSWNAEGLDYITSLCDQDANNPDTYQINTDDAGYWTDTDIIGWFIDDG